MKRKDVQVGLALGAVLLVVILIVWLAGGSGDSGTQVTEPPPTTPTERPIAATPQAARAPAPTPTRAPEVAVNPPATRPATQPTGIAERTDPFANPPPALPSGTGGDDIWERLLATGDTQLIRTATPTPAAVRPTGARDAAAIDAAARPAVTNNSAARAPGSPASRTYIIRSGDSLSRIAQELLGAERHWPALLAANPGLVPERLRVGQTINLPDAAALAGRSTPSVAAPAAARVADPTTEYVVQAGDSLYVIARKLYGDAKEADAIYAANRAAIGADPARIRAGMLLKLPKPPSNASRPATPRAQ